MHLAGSNCRGYFYARQGTNIALVFLTIDGEALWLLPPSLVP